MSILTLDRAPLQIPLLLQDAPGSSTRRLTALGLRRGARLTLLQRTSGGGRIALVGGTRVALGPAVLRQVRVEIAL